MGEGYAITHNYDAFTVRVFLAFSLCYLLLSLTRVIAVCVWQCWVSPSPADTGLVPCVSCRTGRVQPPPARRQEPLQGGQGHGGSLSAGPAPAVHGTARGQQEQGENPPSLHSSGNFCSHSGCSFLRVPCDSVWVQVSHTHSHIQVFCCLTGLPLQPEPPAPHLSIIY